MTTRARSDDYHATLSIWMSSWETTLSNVISYQPLVICICEWIVDIVVDTAMVVESSWLPELLYKAVRMVIIKQILRDVADEE